jgi:hypothetical protein
MGLAGALQPTTTDHVAGNAAVQKTGGGADYPVGFFAPFCRSYLNQQSGTPALHTPTRRDAGV